ncbi:hypothetical protein L1887_36017 [Cichorium endivia]|nr:hypothetical protein L1887_36017 [Cichorium endivia]
MNMDAYRGVISITKLSLYRVKRVFNLHYISAAGTLTQNYRNYTTNRNSLVKPSIFIPYKMAKSYAVGDSNDVEKIFKKFDVNGDGKISISELGSILGALGTVTPEDELKAVMKEIDTDGDGFIDLNEFIEFQRGGSGAVDGATVDKELREAFALYDQNKNGKISANELHSVLKSLGEKCSLKDCRKMIASVDVDGDGSVNFEEFKKMMSK